MHVLWLYFSWPGGAIWGNVLAMPACGIVAVVAGFVFRDRIGSALKAWHQRHFGHHAELDEIRARLDAHADTLSLNSPGGLAAVMSAVQDARTAAESAQGAAEGLAAVVKPAAARTPGTDWRKVGTPGKGQAK